MWFFFFFFNDTATTEIYTLSLHDALPISLLVEVKKGEEARCLVDCVPRRAKYIYPPVAQEDVEVPFPLERIERSEEHTSELQSRPHLVCRLLLEKKK